MPIVLQLHFGSQEEAKLAYKGLQNLGHQLEADFSEPLVLSPVNPSLEADVLSLKQQMATLTQRITVQESSQNSSLRLLELIAQKVGVGQLCGLDGDTTIDGKRTRTVADRFVSKRLKNGENASMEEVKENKDPLQIDAEQ